MLTTQYYIHVRYWLIFFLSNDVLRTDRYNAIYRKGVLYNSHTLVVYILHMSQTARSGRVHNDTYPTCQKVSRSMCYMFCTRVKNIT